MTVKRLRPKVPADAKIESWVKQPDKTVKRWRGSRAGTHPAVKIHTPPQVESIGPEDDASGATAPWLPG